MRVDTVLFDMGGTLEDIRYSGGVPEIIAERMEAILGMPFAEITPLSGEDFFIHLKKRYGEYRDFREQTLIEVHPAMVWKDWILKGLPVPAEVIFDRCEDLALFWETDVIERKCREEAPPMLELLKGRGIRMGIISNTGSFTQVHKSLERYGIGHFFEMIGLSSDYGIRKPHGYLFRDVLNRMGCRAERTLYVGDTLSRDVAGAKNGGLLGSVQIRSEFTGPSDGDQTRELRPDYVVRSLLELPEIIDGINKK